MSQQVYFERGLNLPSRLKNVFKQFNVSLRYFVSVKQPLKIYSAMSKPVFSLICLLLWVFMSVIRYYLAGTKKDFVEQELSVYLSSALS